MFRNFGSQGRGNPPYTGAVSGSSSISLGGASTSTTQQEQKFTMAGSSQFVPSLNAITTNQDLQWLVQPSLMHPPGPSRSPVAPYPTIPATRAMGPQPSPSYLLRPGVIRATTAHSSRRRNDEQLSQDELERRRIRRERNKMAAAKCRNRRRELTDSLQSETDQLEDEKSRLQKEIADLQKEKEKLELVLEAHRPICKIESDSDSDSTPAASSLGAIKMEPVELSIPGPSTKPPIKIEKPKPKITLPTRPVASTSTTFPTESESLHTPILISTPSLLSFSSNMIFTYPAGSSDAGSSTTGSSTTSHVASHQHQGAREPCGIAHRRSSSSGDQSDHSLHSPSILTL